MDKSNDKERDEVQCPRPKGSCDWPHCECAVSTYPSKLSGTIPEQIDRFLHRVADHGPYELSDHAYRIIDNPEYRATRSAVVAFTPEQVKNLDEYQRSGVMHPFTCANRGDGKHFNNGVDEGALIPTTRGWICQCCDYTQDWAHDFMLNGEAVKNAALQTPRSASERTDDARLLWLETLLKHCPHADLTWNDDADEGPLGWRLLVESCSKLDLRAPTLEALIDLGMKAEPDEDGDVVANATDSPSDRRADSQ